MDSAFSPMPGSGAAVDMMSGDPMAVRQAGREAKRERQKHDRQRAELLLLQDLREGEGGEIFRRLLSDLLEQVKVLLMQSMSDEEAIDRLRGAKVRLAVIADTVGHDTAMVIDETTRYAIMDVLAALLQSSIPVRKPNVMP